MLNQSYEPLAVCNVKRAFDMVYLGKADPVLEDDQKFIRSIRKNFRYPVVIRLRRYIHVPYRQVILTRKNILRRDSHRCAYCGKSNIPLTIDHIIPRSKGGENSWENLISACPKCNSKKGDRTPAEAGMTLKFRPYAPNSLFFIKFTVGIFDNRWKPFLFH
ncbi:MAG: HNH endonuclease [Ignavibacteriales bacterium]|nr:HNH endonuclease [Ignavibacteriales bacterium]WKZ73219.1 MAG: HNH endonuclease [Ignavibacteriaceae bacterium]